MNRTDRLYALVEELRSVTPRPRTAAQLAARFEVSVRTIERDLLALQEAGVPIWAQTGPGGGYSVDPATTLPPLNFTAAEATAVAVALAAPGATPLGQAAHTALQKLVAAMAGPAAEAARGLSRRVVAVGRPASAAASVSPEVERALVEGRVVAVLYEDRTGAVTRREVEPAGLVGVDNRWYLVGHCRLRGETRVFRVDRVLGATVLDERVAPGTVDPPDFAGLVRRPNLLE